jgi:hypothetical protein
MRTTRPSIYMYRKVYLSGADFGAKVTNLHSTESETLETPQDEPNATRGHMEGFSEVTFPMTFQWKFSEKISVTFLKTKFTGE